MTDLSGISEYPTWSPDGRWIAFHCTFGHVLSGGTGDFEICVVNADGSGLVQLTDAPGESKLPAWSRVGHLVFSRYGCLMVMNPEDASVVQISKGSCACADSGQFPDWYQRAF